MWSRRAGIETCSTRRGRKFKKGDVENLTKPSTPRVPQGTKNDTPSSILSKRNRVDSGNVEATPPKRSNPGTIIVRGPASGPPPKYDSFGHLIDPEEALHTLPPNLGPPSQEFLWAGLNDAPVLLANLTVPANLNLVQVKNGDTVEAKPTIYGVGSLELLERVTPEVAASWKELDGEAVLARIPFMKGTPGQDMASDRNRLQNFVRTLFQASDNASKILAITGQYVRTPHTEKRPIIPLLIKGLTPDQRAILIEGVAWHSNTLAFFTAPIADHVSRFVMTVMGWSMNGVTGHDDYDLAINAVRRGMRTNPRVHAFLAAHRDALPPPGDTSGPWNVEQTLKYLCHNVTASTIGLEYNDAHELGVVIEWNIYMPSPTNDLVAHAEWIAILREYTYNCAGGCGTPRNPGFDCGVCAASNHPTGMCPYPDMPRWPERAKPSTAKKAKSDNWYARSQSRYQQGQSHHSHNAQSSRQGSQGTGNGGTRGARGRGGRGGRGRTGNF